MPSRAQWQGWPQGTGSAARKVVPSMAQLHADKTITRNAEAAAIALSIFHLVFNAVKWQDLSRLANCSRVIVQNYRIFRAIFFEKVKLALKKGYSWIVPLKP